MNSARSQPQRREQTVHIVDRAAADQRQCAVNLAFHPRQRRDQARGGDHVVRPRRQVEQRAIDVKKRANGAPPNGGAFSIAAPATGGALN